MEIDQMMAGNETSVRFGPDVERKETFKGRV